MVEFSSAIAFFVYPAAMIRAGVGDLLTMKIPNWLVLVLLVAYFVLAPLAGFSAQHIGRSIGVAGLVFLFSFAFFAFGWIGGGDAKLITVVALWLGAAHVPAFLLLTAVLGGLLTLALIMFRLLQLPQAWRRQEWLMRLHSRGAGVPYGLAIAVSGLLIFTATPWVVAGHAP